MTTIEQLKSIGNGSQISAAEKREAKAKVGLLEGQTDPVKAPENIHGPYTFYNLKTKAAFDWNVKAKRWEKRNGK